MPPYRLARLSDEQLSAIESLENEIGVTLVAYEPDPQEVRGAGAAGSSLESVTGDDRLVLDALNDTYRTYDPHDF